MFGSWMAHPMTGAPWDVTKLHHCRGKRARDEASTLTPCASTNCVSTCLGVPVARLDENLTVTCRNSFEVAILSRVMLGTAPALAEGLSIMLSRSFKCVTAGWGWEAHLVPCSRSAGPQGGDLCTRGEPGHRLARSGWAEH